MAKPTAKPFLKWAGGKTQLINEIAGALPSGITKLDFTYVEPFVGSGAVLFWMLDNFPNLRKAVINDINEDLINVYKIIAVNPGELIDILEGLQNEFLALDDRGRKDYYYRKRALYNARREEKIGQAALFIFLNRTCFNGLYRVNKKNEFNVPIGRYKKPLICDKRNIIAVSEALQKVEILCGDFEQTMQHATEHTLFYFDPPYKPLNQTSSFNAYANSGFNDNEQLRLRNFCLELNRCGYKWLLSNSDVKGHNPHDNFFDDMYSGFSIERVKAKRSINAIAEKRGQLNELLITN